VLFPAHHLFCYHLLWPQGFGGNVDVASALIAIAAAAALFIFKRNVMQVIAGASILGLVAYFAQKAVA